MKGSGDIEIAGRRSVLLSSVGYRELIRRRGCQIDCDRIRVGVGVCCEDSAAQAAIIGGRSAGRGAGVVVSSIYVERGYERRGRTAREIQKRGEQKEESHC